MLFIITNSDGETDVRMVDDGAFLEELTNGDYGPNPQFISANYLKDHSDPNSWPEGVILVMRGGVIIPSVVTRAASWGLPK